MILVGMGSKRNPVKGEKKIVPKNAIAFLGTI